MFAQIIARRIKNEPPDSKVIPTCDLRILLIEYSEAIEIIQLLLNIIESPVGVPYSTGQPIINKAKALLSGELNLNRG